MRMIWHAGVSFRELLSTHTHISIHPNPPIQTGAPYNYSHTAYTSLHMCMGKK